MKNILLPGSSTGKPQLQNRNNSFMNDNLPTFLVINTVSVFSYTGLIHQVS